MTQSAAAPQAPTVAAPSSAKAGRFWVALRFVLVLLAISGWWLSFELTRLSLGFETSALTQSACAPDDSGRSACNSVVASSYGSIPISRQGATIPRALLGMIYFAALIAWFLFLGPTRTTGTRWNLALTFFVGIGIGNSLFQIQIMLNVLEQWCTLCGLTHFINFAIAALVLVIGIPQFFSRRQQVHPSWLNRAGLATLALAAVLAFAHFATYLNTRLFAQASGPLAKRYQALLADAEFHRWSYERAAAIDIDPPAGLPTVGPDDAPHRVVVFFDPRCNHCHDAHNLVKQLQASEPELLHVTYVPFPIDTACNDAYPRTVHPDACDRARDLLAVTLTSGFEAFAEHLSALASESDEGEPASRPAASPEADALLEQSIALGKTLKLRAMPAVYVNGKPLLDATVTHGWRVALGLPSTQPAASNEVRE